MSDLPLFLSVCCGPAVIIFVFLAAVWIVDWLKGTEPTELLGIPQDPYFMDGMF